MENLYIMDPINVVLAWIRTQIALAIPLRTSQFCAHFTPNQQVIITYLSKFHDVIWFENIVKSAQKIYHTITSNVLWEGILTSLPVCIF